MRSHKRLAAVALILTAVAVLAAGALYYRHRRRHRLLFWPPKNAGDYAGALDWVAPPFDPSKESSRPWLDAKKSAPPPTTYHTYAASSINGQQTDYLVYLPPGYEDAANAQRRYPVIYFLHGYGSEPQYGGSFVDTLDAAVRAGVAPPIIAVLPNGLYDSWYVDAVDGSQPIESVIVKDLIPHIDRTFRTVANRRARAVEGFSMGAWGAAHLAFKYPDLFCAATLISAPMHSNETFPQPDVPFFRNARAFYAEDPVTLARRNAAGLREKVRTRILIGELDSHLLLARAFDQHLGEWGFSRELTVVPGIGHSDELIYQRLGPAVFGFYKSLFTDSLFEKKDNQEATQ